MKTFATSLSSALLIAGAASAQGVALFGDARLGLGYNIDNDGGVLVDDDGNDARRPARHLPRPLRRQHDRRDRQRHHLRRRRSAPTTPKAARAATTARSRAASSCPAAWGTLTFGDTDAADEQWVGDVPGNYSLTGLTDINETRFISNGGSFGDDNGEHFAENPFARPTVRYDFDIDELRHLGLDQPRPDRHRRRRRLRRRLRRRQLERRRRLLQVRRVRRDRRPDARARRYRRRRRPRTRGPGGGSRASVVPTASSGRSA